MDFVVAPSAIHGLGVFALQTVRKGAILFKYKGRIVAPTERSASAYMFLNAHRNFVVDAADDAGNYLRPMGTDQAGLPLYRYVNVKPLDPHHPTVAKYVNHLPSRLANCRITPGGNIVAKRTIRPGEEVTFSYGRHVKFAPPRGGQDKRLQL